MDKIVAGSTSRQNRTICAPFCSQNYNKIVCNDVKFREALDARIEQFPELFPAEIGTSYLMKDNRESNKLSAIPARHPKNSFLSYAETI
jgi:hypothetical protein